MGTAVAVTLLRVGPRMLGMVRRRLGTEGEAGCLLDSSPTCRWDRLRRSQQSGGGVGKAPAVEAWARSYRNDRRRLSIQLE